MARSLARITNCLALGALVALDRCVGEHFHDRYTQSCDTMEFWPMPRCTPQHRYRARSNRSRGAMTSECDAQHQTACKIRHLIAYIHGSNSSHGTKVHSASDRTEASAPSPSVSKRANSSSLQAAACASGSAALSACSFA